MVGRSHRPVGGGGGRLVAPAGEPGEGEDGVARRVVGGGLRDEPAQTEPAGLARGQGVLRGEGGGGLGHSATSGPGVEEVAELGGVTVGEGAAVHEDEHLAEGDVALRVGDAPVDPRPARHGVPAAVEPRVPRLRRRQGAGRHVVARVVRLLDARPVVVPPRAQPD